MQTSTFSFVDSIFCSPSTCERTYLSPSGPHRLTRRLKDHWHSWVIVPPLSLAQLLILFRSTGGAGLIATIRSFSKGGVLAIIAGVISAIALTGWVIQGVGNLFYYRQVRPSASPITQRKLKPLLLRYGHITTRKGIHLQRYVCSCSEHNHSLNGRNCRRRQNWPHTGPRRTSREAETCFFFSIFLCLKCYTLHCNLCLLHSILYALVSFPE